MTFGNKGYVEAVKDFEKRYVEDLLTKTGGNVKQAAIIAQMDKANFYRIIRRHGIVTENFWDETQKKRLWYLKKGKRDARRD